MPRLGMAAPIPRWKDDAPKHRSQTRRLPAGIAGRFPVVPGYQPWHLLPGGHRGLLLGI